MAREHHALETIFYLKRIPAWKHNLKPFGVHTGPDNYNKAWKVFFSENKYFTGQDVIDEMHRLDEIYGLTIYKWMK